jgi:hypothetical protein
MPLGAAGFHLFSSGEGNKMTSVVCFKIRRICVCVCVCVCVCRTILTFQQEWEKCTCNAIGSNYSEFL